MVALADETRTPATWKQIQRARETSLGVSSACDAVTLLKLVCLRFGRFFVNGPCCWGAGQNIPDRLQV